MTLDLDRLAALEAAATPGEWCEEHLGDMTRAHIFAGPREECYHVAIVFPNEEGFWEAGRTHANAALIAALRNDARALIAAAREREGLAAENATAWEQAGQDRAKLNEVLLAYARLARAVRAQASAQAAATGSDSAAWVDFVSADVLAALEEVGDGDE